MQEPGLGRAFLCLECWLEGARAGWLMLRFAQIGAPPGYSDWRVVPRDFFPWLHPAANSRCLVDAKDSMSGDVNLRFVDRRDDQLAHRHLDARAMPRDETGIFQPVAGKSHPRERGHFGSVFLWVEFAEVAPRLPNGYGAVGETVWCVMILFSHF